MEPDLDVLRGHAIVKEDLATQVYRALMHCIVTRVYAPGERLSIQSVADTFDVSVTPVREAFHRLAREGLVESRPRSGTTVAEITLRDIVEIYDIRLMIEVSAAGVPFETDTIQAMLASIYQMDELAGMRLYDDFEAYWTYSSHDAEFHRLLVEGTGNGRLMSIYRDLHAHTLIAPVLFGLKAIARVEEQHEEHRTIVDALEVGDGKRAVDAVRRHLTRTLDVLQQRWPEALHAVR